MQEVQYEDAEAPVEQVEEEDAREEEAPHHASPEGPPLGEELDMLIWKEDGRFAILLVKIRP